MYVDSSINTSLRNYGTEPCNTYYQQGDLSNYLRNKILFYDEEGGAFAPRPILCPEFYEYNRDYSVMPCDTVYFPLTRVYDYCSQCIGDHSTRIVWSPKSFDEDLFDTYSVNNVNDYDDMPGHKGDVTDLMYKNNYLFTHSEESTFVSRPNPQTIQLDNTEAYLGTGTFLGVPEQEINEADLGYAGKQTLLDHINTEHGYTWVDQKHGKIFNYTNGLEEISRNGMYHWFKENLPSKIEEVNTTSNTIAQDNWLIGTYDPKNERYILHKKDYRVKNNLTIGNLDGRNTIRFDGTNFYHNGQQIFLDDTDFFCDCSWTISYSYKYKAWRSWHSYMPTWAYYDDKTFYTFEDH